MEANSDIVGVCLFLILSPHLFHNKTFSYTSLIHPIFALISIYDTSYFTDTLKKFKQEHKNKNYFLFLIIFITFASLKHKGSFHFLETPKQSNISTFICIAKKSYHQKRYPNCWV